MSWESSSAQTRQMSVLGDPPARKSWHKYSEIGPDHPLWGEPFTEQEGTAVTELLQRVEITRQNREIAYLKVAIEQVRDRLAATTAKGQKDAKEMARLQEELKGDKWRSEVLRLEADITELKTKLAEQSQPDAEVMVLMNEKEKLQTELKEAEERFETENNGLKSEVSYLEGTIYKLRERLAATTFKEKVEAQAKEKLEESLSKANEHHFKENTELKKKVTALEETVVKLRERLAKKAKESVVKKQPIVYICDGCAEKDSATDAPAPGRWGGGRRRKGKRMFRIN